MTIASTCEFIARQLNDHEDCDHGVRQGTYHTWKEAHIKEAIQHALSYLYAIKPDTFAKPITYQTTSTSCVLDTSGACSKPLEILSIGDNCDNVLVETDETNDLLGLLTSPCVTTTTEDTQYTLTQKSGTVYVSGSDIPKGSTISLLCAAPPNTATVSNDLLLEYQPLITAFALWWLLLTDNESRSNQPRWEAYFEQVKWFVETKLLIEFSLSEDDYRYGRRRVND